MPKEKIALIEHGVPDIHFNPEKSKKEFKLESKKVLLTFGFIGRSKGIETVIKALPEVVKKFPELNLYRFRENPPECTAAFRRRIPYFSFTFGEKPTSRKSCHISKRIY